MPGIDEDDKPTVVLDLEALKKQKIKQEEDLAKMATELEFTMPQTEDADEEEFEYEEDFQQEKQEASHTSLGRDNFSNHQVAKDQIQKLNELPIILFDFDSDFFQKSLGKFPAGYQYKIIHSLAELNQCLKFKGFQIIIFNYDVNPKAVNQLCAQIKVKMPLTKTMIMARAISPQKAAIHAKSASGASGYYQFPLEAKRVEKEFNKIKGQVS